MTTKKFRHLIHPKQMIALSCLAARLGLNVYRSSYKPPHQARQLDSRGAQARLFALPIDTCRPNTPPLVDDSFSTFPVPKKKIPKKVTARFSRLSMPRCFAPSKSIHYTKKKNTIYVSYH